MLEGLVAWVLNNYLGKYVENLNTDQLSIALLSGEVELENLPLKKDALRHFGVPVQVQAGFIGKIKLQIPLRQIRSAPWVIAIEQLYLVATPVNLSEWDNEAEEYMAQEFKLSLLDALEAQWRADNESQPDAGYYASSFSSWMNYGTSLVTNIIENLQLKIKDVHLRYEDYITCGETNAFACGLIMDSFSAESCDSNWQRSFTTLSSSQLGGCSFKLLELQKMAFYWDRISLPNDVLANLSLGELAIRMCEMKSSEHRFVVSPVSAVAHLRRERSEQPLRSHARPRFTCQLSLDRVPLILTNCQYNEMIGCVRGLSLIGKLRVFRQWRPNTSIKENCRAWWIYAVKCHFPDSNFMEPKPTWESCLSSAKLCRHYVEMYSSLLVTPSLTLPPESKELKDQVEWSSPFQQLKLLRESAMRRAPSGIRNAAKSKLVTEGEGAQGRWMLMRWFPQWWGWYSAPLPHSPAASTSPSNSSPSLEGEILDVLADSIENNTLLKRDAVFGSFQFNLSKGSLQFCEDHSQKSTNENANKVTLEFQFENVGFSVESRPRTSSHTVSVTLGAVYLKDHLIENTLFPTLIAPQGTIREGLGGVKFPAGPANWTKHSVGNTSSSSLTTTADPLFHLAYEKKPVGLNVDYRLFIKSQSLEIVYNAGAVKWLIDFLSHPLSISGRSKLPVPESISNQIGAYVHVKNTTKKRLFNHWEHILQGNLSERSLWQLELDISAPQIFLVEKFTDKNGVVVVLDFGKMHLSNGFVENQQNDPVTEDDENEMFMTPCSTPPGSEVSDLNLTDCGASPIPADFSQPQMNASLNQDALHHRIYDRYKIEFSDLQVLVGRIRDNWKYSNTKGASSLHILDRFNISLQVERRVIYTSDPQFPSVTLCGTLPNLVVHLNEHKLLSIQSLIAELQSPQTLVSSSLSTMPLNEDWKISPPTEEQSNENSDAEYTERSYNQYSRLLMVQFAIDQLALEVQSRGRSIAEVQVCGVRAALTKRPFDFNLSLSVHSLLLVDALQTYGPDFELLIASHKHVGMDSVSGSIRDSEPTSPVSPSSPPECHSARPLHPPPPAALTQALHYLNTQSKTSAARWCVSPTLDGSGNAAVAGIVDSEALIVIELTIVNSDCPSNPGEELRIANILFNNLDIIANQETIVELIGFTKRVSSIAQPLPKRIPSESILKSSTSNILPEDNACAEEVLTIVRTEITFDFHRLSVLLLRATVQDGHIVGKKIATATMSDAKIQATVANTSMELNGSLGGLQIVSLCPGTTLHQRIVSVGHDPLAHHNVTLTTDLAQSLAQEVYKGFINNPTLNQEEGKALSFNITKTVADVTSDGTLNAEASDEVNLGIHVHVASVWYTHSGIFIGEIQSCATEFKQYLSNLARSIKAAATDMAIGLVQARGDSLYSNPRVSGSTEGVSPRRPRSISFGFPQDSETSVDIHSTVIHLKMDIVLDTPVVVLPRAPMSTEVFVAHLGNIVISNKPGVTQYYNIQVRDINVYSLDTANHINNSQGADTVESVYSCGAEGKPILHDTTLQLTVERISTASEGSLPCEHYFQIIGKVVTPLKVSSTRHQYEQMLDTVSSLNVIFPMPAADPPPEYMRTADSTGVTTLGMDPHLRAQIFSALPLMSPSVDSFQHFKVDFHLPIFTVELRGDFGKGEQSVVNLSFRDFIVNYEKCQLQEINIKISLRSITMEDLLRDVDSRHRFMMVSHKPLIPKANFVSRSSPDLRSDGFEDFNVQPITRNLSNMKNRSSLPDQLHHINGMESKLSPSKPVKQMSLPKDNLVLISMQLRDPQNPLFREKYKNVRKVTNIDFNCLDLVVSVDSWVVVLDFFGMGSDAKDNIDKKLISSKPDDKLQLDTGSSEETKTELSVRSLNVVLLRPQREVCRANISGLEVLVINSSSGQGGRKISGTLSSMSLTDLSPHGRIWKERFLYSGKEALSFEYERFRPEEASIADCDTKLLIKMSSIIYVHTKRFVREIDAFFREFSRLQNVFSEARQKVSVTANSPSTRMQLSIECLSPAILVPVSSRSTSVLVADVGKLFVNNTFKKAGSPDTISIVRDLDNPIRELLDVMSINLEYMDLYCGEKIALGDGVSCSTPIDGNSNVTEEDISLNILSIGSSGAVLRHGPYLLTNKCGLHLQVERNLEQHHNVADLSIQGTLNTLDGAIDLVQYKVIKGLLSNNLGENIDDLYVSESSNVQLHSSLEDGKTWTFTSIRLDLLNVTVMLQTQHGKSSLACINFIKSRLVVETFSDMTQDIDLVSQEISVSDTRYKTDPVNKRSNVFSDIVRPMGLVDHNGVHSVQAEVHARKRREHSAYTILVNNMRLMAILDWWQAVNEFIMSPPTTDTIDLKFQAKPSHREGSSNCRQSPVVESHFELKLNITESQVVFVEDTSQLDANAVILKSTTVISYKPGSEPKPLSCVLNHCEVFSCVLGMEEETALSIIDPVTVQIDLNSMRVLQVQSPQLSVRLSYHDVRMLLKMFHSLPQQTRGGRAANDPNVLPVNQNRESIQKLCGLGFSAKDCATALSISDGRLDQAALWLTENPTAIISFPYRSPYPPAPDPQTYSSPAAFDCIQVKAECISICVIDDCRDSDVPLLELSLSQMNLSQDLRESDSTGLGIISPQSPPLILSPEAHVSEEVERQTGPGGGKLQCKLTSDYYNRALSGWEPFIEPWRCDASWEYGLTSTLRRNKLHMEVNSTETLNVNVTSTLMDLYKLVKTNWTQDYYSLTNRGESSPKSSPPGYRRRSPFVPFALLNQTGCKLWFTTIITTADVVSENVLLAEPDESWSEVFPGMTAPFKFGSRGKQRHRDSHKLRLHQLGIRIDGWNSISPVCVDKVGVFFRNATHTSSDIEARVVFAVSLEGSARKLVTVRSALQLVNQLPEPIEVRADNITVKSPSVWSSTASPRSVQVKSGDTWCVPLSHNPCPMWVRPLSGSRALLYCAQPLDWRLAARLAPDDTLQLPHVCHSNNQTSYRFCCIMRREHFPSERGLPQPGHILILKPPVRLVNLLPVELNYKLGQNDQGMGRVSPGQTAPLSQIDVLKIIEISIYLEGFPGSAVLVIPPTATASFSLRLKLSDMSGRKLSLSAHISIKRSDTIKVSIYAAYWIVNRTGVPIVFRQEGVPTETAGQFEEHESARMVAPLLFSFADSDGSPTVVARVGAAVIPKGQPQWCSSFGLGSGIMVRRLVVGNIGGSGAAERVLLVGIAVRPGRGRYRYTNICTISPRFQIHNNTSFHLQFSQKCYATTMADPGAVASHVSAIPGCSMPFHWPRQDRDQLLCVRLLDLPNSNWSGGFRIDTNHSLHINIRDNAECFFLRLEVVLQGATYFIVFTDADTMPPPIRLDNYSLVQLTFHQVGCKDESLLKAHTSKPWALLEPCGVAMLAVRAPGGTGTTIDLHKLDEVKSLTYQNFIYIAFTGTHQKQAGDDLESMQLVLEVEDSGRVVLARRRTGERSQLWRLSPRGHLLHEGSSPPQPAHAPPDVTAPHAQVLDIEGPAPQPSTMVGLCVRRVNPRRASTQTWHFTLDGRLRCAHNNMNVQPLDGFFGLRQGNRAVLGLPGPPGPHILPGGIPVEQAICSQSLRPGSGSLTVTVITDGPTRVVKIMDIKQHEDNWCEGKSESGNSSEMDAHPSTSGLANHRSADEVQVRVAVGGVGLSLVSRAPPLELLFCLFNGVLLETVWSPRGQALNLSVQDIQCDNQLLGTPCPVLLHSTKIRGSGSSVALPTVQMSTERTAAPPATRYNAHIFKHFIITLRPISVHLEERLLLKLCLWAGIGGEGEEMLDKEEPDETDFETLKILSEVTAAHAKRYYFGVLKLNPSQIRLSMQTAGKLSPRLLALKRRLGLTLIKFEDAGVELEPFIRWHPFETSQFLWHSIIKHYRDELKWQAAIILGSVDFLGNPLGFVQDVSDGVSGLIYEGNVGALVKNVTHGLSNSAAKVTESLGDGIGRVILDEAHEETRARIRGRGGGQGGGGSAGGHLAAGLRGLGLGLLGGVTSLVKHSYEGAQTQGLSGFLAGVGKGLVGTVTKPVVGVLDLAAETAAALRDTSRSSERWVPERSRPPRCPMGPGGLLPRYSRSQSTGRQYLYSINNRDYQEGFLAYDCIRGHPYDIRALVSTRNLRIFTCTSGEPHIVTETHLSNLLSCQAVASGMGEYYIELTVRVDGSGGAGVRRPQVQCDTGELARWVTHQVNYAKCMFHEKLYTLQEADYDFD